jgi:acyl-CoA reductase-like NAD-dependent aldehyde dehydrogenase
MAQEIFGPGAPVVPFYTEDEAVGMANDSPWRLAGHLLTQEVDDAFGGVGPQGRHVARNTGALSNPPPCEGVKVSHLGREGFPRGIDKSSSSSAWRSRRCDPLVAAKVDRSLHVRALSGASAPLKCPVSVPCAGHRR